MNILMLSATFPYPPTRGGTQVRTCNLLARLSQNHQISLATLRGADVTDEEIEALRQQVAELAVFPRPLPAAGGAIAKLRRLADFARSGTPASVRGSYTAEMQAWASDRVTAGKADVVTCEHSVNEIYVAPGWRDRLRTIANIHSSIYGTIAQQLRSGTAEKPLRDRLTLPLLRRYERRFCDKFSGLVVTTEEDRQFFRNFRNEEEIAVIANGVDLDRFPYRPRDPGGRSLVFCGAMDNLPNIDAARFFSLEVWPRLRQKYPDATLKLVGGNPVPEVRALGDLPGITATGRVPSMADYLHEATACVVPMRTGFGIKNKTLEAMAAGTPVVGSDRGLEGLQVEEPLRALRANRVSEYLAAIERLFDAPSPNNGDNTEEARSLRECLSRNARDYIEREFTWESAARRYEHFLLKGL